MAEQEKKQEKKREDPKAPVCTTWERRWSQAMPTPIIEKAIRKEVVRRECVRIFSKSEKREGKE